MLGLEEAFDDIPGITASMLIAFGNSGIRTTEDLAACATDDLLGWTERRGDKVTMHPGILGDMGVSRTQCDRIILQARVRAGCIELLFGLVPRRRCAVSQRTSRFSQEGYPHATGCRSKALLETAMPLSRQVGAYGKRRFIRR
jgi:hypothetical protein